MTLKKAKTSERGGDYILIKGLKWCLIGLTVMVFSVPIFFFISYHAENGNLPCNFYKITGYNSFSMNTSEVNYVINNCLSYGAWKELNPGCEKICMCMNGVCECENYYSNHKCTEEDLK